MRNCLIASTVLLLVMFAFFATACSDRVETADEEAAKTIPDLSGIWEGPINLTPDGRERFDLCGEPTCDELLSKIPLPQGDTTVEEPQMLPWAEEKYKAAREGVPERIPFGREDVNPWFSACMPMGPSWLILSPFIAVELRQFPDMVLLFFSGSAGEGDHTVRRVYLDGRGHPANLQPTSMGQSIGRYDGDALVVDTIGINGERWIDEQGHPHSDALHLVERIRRVNQKNLEVEVTIDDPKAYKNSWRKKIVRQSAASGPRIWDIADCEELLRMGTHFSAEAQK
jgi:hypothetical protein